MPKLIAIGRFFYNGRNVEANEEFDALDQDVALLTHSVSPSARVAPKAEKLEKPEEQPQRVPQPARKTRTYRRRDMTAKD